MQNLYNQTLMDTDILRMMIPASKVAFVDLRNSLEHALLVLTQSGYSAIPVLNRDESVVGVINTNLIIKDILSVNGYDTEKLRSHLVEQVMQRDIPRVKESQHFFRAFELAINWPFVCVVNDQERFVGMLTRKSILALLYQHLRSHPGQS